MARKLKEPTDNLYVAAKKIWETVVSKDATATYELELKLEFHKQLLNIVHVGSYYYFIFNIPKVTFEYMSDGITKVLGYTPEEVTLEFFLDIIHPDDKPYFLNYESKIASFYKDLPFEKVSKYKTQYDMRVKAKNGRYVRILQQAVQVEYDESNFYRTFDLQTDISHIKQQGKPTFSIIGMDGEPSYYNIADSGQYNNTYALFTKREREILQLIIDGKSSSEIASELHVSIHTIHTHRKNILQKAECKTPIDLVHKAITEGWV